MVAPCNDSGDVKTIMNNHIQGMDHDMSRIKGDIPAGTSLFARIALYAALVVGGSYVFADLINPNPTALLLWKGGGVWLLAVYAALQAKTVDGWLITVVMALGAAGDVMVETDLTRGAMAFAAGHVVAIGLYARNRRVKLTPSQMALALTIVPATMLIAWAVPKDRAGVAALVTYALFLGLMAATAWISRFPRYRTGIGAMLFLISDLLIFAQLGPLANATWVGFAIWGLYFAGQVLIVIGVTKAIGNDAVGLQ
jgi:uncharacterized membrane protein YhhN